MENLDLWKFSRDDRLLTDASSLARLLSLMAAWWEGQGLARMAASHDLSRQRVAAILARVKCTRAAWHRAGRDKPASKRRAVPNAVERARAALLHPLEPKLTPGQRAALAWKAAELVDVEIARRMGITGARVRQHIIGGIWRLDRLARLAAKPPLEPPPAGPVAPVAPPELPPMAPLEVEDIVPAPGEGGPEGAPAWPVFDPFPPADAEAEDSAPGAPCANPARTGRRGAPYWPTSRQVPPADPTYEPAPPSRPGANPARPAARHGAGPLPTHPGTEAASPPPGAPRLIPPP